MSCWCGSARVDGCSTTRCAGGARRRSLARYRGISQHESWQVRACVLRFADALLLRHLCKPASECVHAAARSCVQGGRLLRRGGATTVLAMPALAVARCSSLSPGVLRPNETQCTRFGRAVPRAARARVAAADAPGPSAAASYRTRQRTPRQVPESCSVCRKRRKARCALPRSSRCWWRRRPPSRWRLAAACRRTTCRSPWPSTARPSSRAPASPPCRCARACMQGRRCTRATASEHASRALAHACVLACCWLLAGLARGAAR